jgi:ATP-binding cassette subfamily F protein uup
LLGDEVLRDLPRGVDQYLEQRADAVSSRGNTTPKQSSGSSAAEQRQLKKDKVRLERQMEKVEAKITELEAKLEIVASDVEGLQVVNDDLLLLHAEKDKFEQEWLQVTLLLES